LPANPGLHHQIRYKEHEILAEFLSDVARITGHWKKCTSEFVEGKCHNTVAEPECLMRNKILTEATAVESSTSSTPSPWWMSISM
jgi:hypothetical protein